MGKERKTDSRVARTKAAIQRAYLNLLGQKDSGDITVTDVAQAADVDRKTVYNYYEGVSAICEELENELVQYAGKAIEELLTKRVRDPLGFLRAVTDSFADHGELTGPLMQKNRHSQVLQKLGDAFSARIGRLLAERISPDRKPYAKLYADFIIGGIILMYRDWIGAGMQQPLEELAGQIRLLLNSGIEPFIV